MTQLNIVLATVGGLLLLLGLFSRVFKRWGLPEPLVLLLAGIALGPQGAEVLRPASWGDWQIVLEQASRLALAVGLMGVALRIPRRFLSCQLWPILLVTAVVMVFMWISSSLLIGLIVGLPLWTALLIGAIVTPTDPVAASVIVTGELATENLPARVRHLISAESGFNDGLASPFVLLPILVLSTRLSEGVIWHWLLQVVLWELGIALVLGAVIGTAAGWLLTWAERRQLIDEPSIISYTIALALFTVGVVRLIEGEGLLAVFIAGLVFDQMVNARERTNEERVVEGIDRFFTLPVFGLCGLLLPWDAWRGMGWQSVLTLVVAILLLRRLPILLLFTGRLPLLPRLADTLVVGWFGPLGVAALFYAGTAMRKTQVDDLWPVVSLLVVASVLVHGVSSGPLIRWYSKRARR